MMFAKDIKDHADYNPFVARRPKKVSAAVDDVDVELVIVGNNPNYNAGFATRKAMLDNHGRFSCAIPLSHIFGFCRHVQKVTFGASHTVVLARRQTDDYALWHGAGVDHGAVKLSKLSLWMPIMTPSLTVETRLLSFMDQGGRSLMSWADITTATTTGTVAGVFTWQLALTKNISAPMHIFVALQNLNRTQAGADHLQLRSHMIFDQCGVSEVSL